MINLKKIPLFNEKCSLYTGGLCHKNFWLFLNPKKCSVDVYTHCLKKIVSIETEKYQSITENKQECYFILTKENEKNYLYKATYDFLEFDSIELHVPNKYKTTINDIYYDEKNKQIIIVTDNFVYAVTIDGYFIKDLTINSLPNNIAIRNLNGCCMRPSVPKIPMFQYTAVGFCKHLYIANKENENAYLKILEEENCPIDYICLGKDIKVVSIFVCCQKLYLLVIKNNHYNYLYETDICCKKEACCCDCCKKEECCCDCCKKEECCCDCCKNECHCLCKCHDKECHHHCTDPVAYLLESVALVETSLSHILNAEGEKIQKAIADDADICEMLEINNSVTDSIFNVTMLEHVLQNKIEKALQYDKCKKKCHECREENKNPHNDYCSEFKKNYNNHES